MLGLKVALWTKLVVADMERVVRKVLSYQALAAGLCLAMPAAALDLLPESPLTIRPNLQLEFGYDENINQTDNADDKQSSLFTTLSPQIGFFGQQTGDRYYAYYQPRLTLYSSESDRNRFSQALRLGTSQDLDARNQLSLDVSLDDIEEPLTDINEASGESENERRVTRVSTSWDFGAPGARGGLGLDAAYRWQRYGNNLVGGSNLVDGSNNRSREYNNPSLRGRFSVRLTGKTRGIVELGYSDFDYQWAGSDLDSYNLSALTGLSWDVTGKTSGDVRVGRERKIFRADGPDNRSTNTWRVGATWNPRSQDRLRLQTSNRLREGSSRENVIESRDTTLRWNHDWTGRVSTAVELGYRINDYYGGSRDGREDKLTRVELGIDYGFRRWLDLGFRIRRLDNDSNQPGGGYQRDTIFFNVSLNI